MRILILLLTIITLSSCKYGITFSNFKKMKDKKEKLQNIYLEELTTENHLVIRDYFGEMKNLAYEFKSNRYMQNNMHRNFSRYYNESFCLNNLISNDVYLEIMRKCEVSGFFICSEEVKYYKEILLEMKKLLTDFEINKISKNFTCKEKLLRLGVLNE